MRQSMFALFAVVGGTALLAQVPQTAAPQSLWTVTGLAGPRSAYYHQQSNSIFVSNYEGGRINTAEPGAYIVSGLLSRKLLHVAGDGKVTTLVTFERGSADHFFGAASFRSP